LAVFGEVEHRIGAEMVPVRPGCAFVQSPLQPVEVKTPERFDLFFLKVEAAHVLRELETLLQRKVTAPLIFSPRFHLGSEAGLRFRRILLTLSTRLNQESKAPPTSTQETTGHSVQELENDLVTLLLEAQYHNYSRLLARHRDAGTWQLRAAEEYIRANAHLSLSLGDICSAVGVNSRTLQHSFQRKRSVSPMQFLRQLRLESVRTELLQPHPATTVTTAASRWGFLHFGRFAAEYHAKFGEKPSATLQRARLHC
jgi:AraC-like DNA-binding protein